jgi:hypothetical protein
MVDVFKPRLDAIMKHPDNLFCADCSDRAPRWSSVKLGILICANCAGIHRKLGTHISFVQSLTIDKWKLEWVELCEKIGNRLSNIYYEATIPDHMKRPTPMTSGGTSGDTMDSVYASRLEKWLRNKYELRLFVPADTVEPAELVRQGYNPRQEESIQKEKKSKKKEKKSTRDDSLSPVSEPVQFRPTNQPSPTVQTPIILPADWRSNIFLRSWALANGVSPG